MWGDEVTYYGVWTKEGKNWEKAVLTVYGDYLHDTLAEAMLYAKGYEALGKLVKVKPVYISWSGSRRVGKAVYDSMKGKKEKQDGKVQKA